MKFYTIVYSPSSRRHIHTHRHISQMNPLNFHIYLKRKFMTNAIKLESRLLVNLGEIWGAAHWVEVRIMGLCGVVLSLSCSG